MNTSSASFSSLGNSPSESFSLGERETSFAAISPELFLAFNFFINQTSFGGIAWRKAVDDKPQTNALDKNDLTSKPLHIKNQFTGSPAYKELKNLIATILLNSSTQKTKPE